MQLDVAVVPALEVEPPPPLPPLLHADTMRATAATPVVAAREWRCWRRERRCSGPVMGSLLSEGPWPATRPMDSFKAYDTHEYATAIAVWREVKALQIPGDETVTWSLHVICLVTRGSDLL
jgi:hypothetical protein